MNLFHINLFGVGELNDFVARLFGNLHRRRSLSEEVDLGHENLKISDQTIKSGDNCDFVNIFAK
jgi:hypothetical protein